MWEKELAVAREAATESGRLLRDMFGNVSRIIKKGEIDLVTEADLQSEKIILEILSRNFPRDTILTEESGIHNKLPERTWIVDPLDGTTNFAHNFPFFAVSIALEVKGMPVLGIVNNPYFEEKFEAVKDNGAFLNQDPIKVSTTNELRNSLLATGFPYNIYKDPDTVLDLLKEMIVAAQGVRRPGSAAIDLCYVAAGRLDGFWEQDLMPWDTAAGNLIVSEAGGTVSDYHGNPYTPFKKSIIASNSHIHEKIINTLKKVAG